MLGPTYGYSTPFSNLLAKRTNEATNDHCIDPHPFANLTELSNNSEPFAKLESALRVEYRIEKTQGVSQFLRLKIGGRSALAYDSHGENAIHPPKTRNRDRNVDLTICFAQHQFVPPIISTYHSKMTKKSTNWRVLLLTTQPARRFFWEDGHQQLIARLACTVNI